MKIALTLSNMLALTEADLAEMNRDELQALRSKLTDKILSLDKNVDKARNDASSSDEWATFRALAFQRNDLIKIRQTVRAKLS